MDYGRLKVRLLSIAALPFYAAAMSVTLTPSTDAPAPVGTIIRWTAAVSHAGPGTLWYRFRVKQPGASFHMIRDYGPPAWIDWTATEREGLYEMELSAINLTTGKTAATSLPYQFSPLVTGTDPVAVPTVNPLVYLYSAPPCVGGSRMRVYFQSSLGGVQSTPYKACSTGVSMNFYLAGLRANASYIAWHVVETGSQSINGPPVSFDTGDSGAPAALFNATVMQNSLGFPSKGALLASSFVVPAATDLAGNLIWYVSNGTSFVTSADRGGYFWGIVENSQLDSPYQLIRKFDVTGMTILETNAGRVNQQLAALGKRQISAFHHDVKTLPDGRIAALAAVEQILTGVQGTGSADILGDMVIVFDSQLNVVWTWDAFDHLDVNRAAVLGEICTAAGGGCPPYYLSPTVNDWTHANSLQQTADGNLLVSMRHQDWIVKIAYDKGAGDGHVIWRLGKDGDFRLDSSDPYPWFSHQHDANFVSGDPTLLMVFDDGNTRVATQGSGNSRGQALRIDERNRTASLVLNADLGVYSIALGTAQKLKNGDYSFDAGYVLDQNSPTGSYAYGLELDAFGTLRYKVQATSILYRWIRMADLYTPE